jgi:hypothetical protein
MTRRQKWLTGIVTLILLVLLFFVAWGEVQARELSPSILVPVFIAPLTILIVVLAASNDQQTTPPPTEDRRSLISRIVDEADDDERDYLRRMVDDRKRKTS